MILYVNACVREYSRTDDLARTLLERLGGSYIERKLSDEPLAPLSRSSLEYRTGKLNEGGYADPIFRYAKEFAEADKIVISAPYWDLSFPSLLKVYIENIYATGIVSRYGENGVPEGLCRANMLYYVTTAGGPYDPRFSFDYIKELCNGYFGIANVKLIKAEMLDVIGYDPVAIIAETKRLIRMGMKLD